jgi:hypothetical protein
MPPNGGRLMNMMMLVICCLLVLAKDYFLFRIAQQGILKAAAL